MQRVLLSQQQQLWFLAWGLFAFILHIIIHNMQKFNWTVKLKYQSTVNAVNAM
jgi:hypothetical protein